MRRTLLLAPVLAALTLSACSSSPSSSTTTTTHPAGSAVVAPAVANATTLTAQPVISAGAGSPPSQLTFKDLVVGHGTLADTSSTVTIKYVGALYNNGHIFDDSTWTSGKALGPYPLNQFVPGFTQGISGMHVGGRREIVIPPRLAYGAQGYPPAIPPNATIVFVVDLQQVQ